MEKTITDLASLPAPNFGPAGDTVFNRTYSRPRPDGTYETWAQTVRRVVDGNLAFTYGDESQWSDAVWAEADELFDHIYNFRILPAGRHLWATGTAKGSEHLNNCWYSHWTDRLSDHFEFTFMRLMEGGGVGSNYSSKFLEPIGLPMRELEVHIVCDESHADYETMKAAGILSTEYCSDWEGAYEVADSREGWAAALVDLIDTFMTNEPVKHSKRVYDISYVRPAGARLKTFGGTASGPSPFAVMMHKVADVLNGVVGGPFPITPLDAMEMDHAIAECVVSGGVRRSARMAIVRWDDPFIFDFIESKSDFSKHWTTNISVEIDDEFIQYASGTRGIWAGNDLNARAIKARQVHASVVEGMLKNGEPGYWNSSLSNVGELATIHGTNPCGELLLDAWEPCCLAHVNLDAFAPKAGGDVLDWGGIVRAHELTTRFAIRATFAGVADEKSREVVNRNRRIGVGHLGVQGFLNKQGFKFSDVARETSVAGRNFRTMLASMYAVVDKEAADYAYELRIPKPIKLTTVAPTGSIAKLPGVTEGIHPIYARYYEQRIRYSVVDERQAETVRKAEADGFAVEVDQYDASGNTMIVVYPSKNLLVEQVEALGYSDTLVEQADELDLETQLAFQAMYQKFWADNAVSMTVNFPEGSLSTETAASALGKWLPLLKGTTLMPDGTRPQAPYTRLSREQYETYGITQVDDGLDIDCTTGACPIR